MLLEKAGVAAEDMDEGLIALSGKSDVRGFLKACTQLRLWARELKVDLDAEAFLEG